MSKPNFNKFLLCSVLISFFVPNAFASFKAGKTIMVQGDVLATSSADGNPRILKRRTLIYSDDTVITGSSSKVQLLMTDEGKIALKENTVLKISDYKSKHEDLVVLDLVKGGIRSLTGNNKTQTHHLINPVSSIVTNGTHYEVEILNDKLWIAVWHGAVDVTVNVGPRSGSIISLGEGENYSYASIDLNGVITRLLQPPKVFEQGLSSLAEKVSNLTNNYEALLSTVDELSQQSLIPDAETIITYLEEEASEFITDDEFNHLKPNDIADLVAAKQGIIAYSEATVISVYNLSNFSAGMAIDFDSGLISNGQLTFNDDRSSEQWNAVFNGNMYIRNDEVMLETDITFASHGNNLADGNITAGFVELYGIDAVIGGFALYELTDNPNVDGITVNGIYTIK